MVDIENPRTLPELIERTDRQWRAWVDAVEGIPDERLAEPMVGHWSGKDLIGHVAFWEDWVIGECQRILAGDDPTEDELDPLNQRQVEERNDRSVAEQKRYRDEAHARLMAFLASLRDDEPKLPDLITALEWETYAHYDEHAAQAQAWRKAEGL